MEMRELEKAEEAGRGAGLIGEGRGREEGLSCKDVQVEEESVVSRAVNLYCVPVH